MPTDYIPPTLVQLLDFLGADLETERHRRATKGGQQCGPSGEFYGAPPSMITKLDRWLRDLREAHAREAAAATQALNDARVWSRRWKALAKWCLTKWQRRRVEAGFDGDASLFIERMGPVDGGFEVSLRGDCVVTEMADALMHLLDDAKAPNTIECRLTDHKGDGVIVEVRRQHGKTMATLRDEATAALAAERDAHAATRAALHDAQLAKADAMAHAEQCQATRDARTAGQRINERLSLASDIVTTQRTLVSLGPLDVVQRVKLKGQLATLRARADDLDAQAVPRG